MSPADDAVPIAVKKKIVRWQQNIYSKLAGANIKKNRNLYWNYEVTKAI